MAESASALEALIENAIENEPDRVENIVNKIWPQIQHFFKDKNVSDFEKKKFSLFHFLLSNEKDGFVAAADEIISDETLVHLTGTRYQTKSKLLHLLFGHIQLEFPLPKSYSPTFVELERKLKNPEPYVRKLIERASNAKAIVHEIALHYDSLLRLLILFYHELFKGTSNNLDQLFARTLEALELYNVMGGFREISEFFDNNIDEYTSPVVLSVFSINGNKNPLRELNWESLSRVNNTFLQSLYKAHAVDLNIADLREELARLDFELSKVEKIISANRKAEKERRDKLQDTIRAKKSELEHMVDEFVNSVLDKVKNYYDELDEHYAIPRSMAIVVNAFDINGRPVCGYLSQEDISEKKRDEFSKQEYSLDTISAYTTEYGGVLSWFYPTVPIYTPNLNLSYYLSPYQDNLQDVLLPDLNFNPQFVSQELLSQKYYMLPDDKERKPLPNVDYESAYQFHHIIELKTEQKAHLRQKMTDHLNYNDLRTLCFDYDFYDHDEITESRGKAAVIIAIIDECRRKGRIPELLSALYKEYPKIEWIQ